jgi:hypothetical protein
MNVRPEDMLDLVDVLRAVGGGLDAPALEHVSCYALANHIESLRNALMRVQNFPSHPGGHPADESDQADDPASWRHGWLCAVAAMQEKAVP